MAREVLLEIQNPSESYLMCKNMITDVFKKEKEIEGDLPEDAVAELADANKFAE